MLYIHDHQDRDVLPPGAGKALPERAQRSGISFECLCLLEQLHPFVRTLFDTYGKQQAYLQTCNAIFIEEEFVGEIKRILHLFRSS